jgi:hypothetical protein
MSPGIEQLLRQRLQAAGLDQDAVTVILRTSKRADLTEALADEWANGWAGQTLLDLASLSPADRQHTLARLVDDFLQQPVHRELRVRHAAAHPTDADLRTAGQLALDLIDTLTAFDRDVTVPAVSPFTGKVKYAVLTDLDVVTTTAVIEVSTQHDAAGKVSQLALLQGAVANPLSLPIFHLLPNVNPNALPAQSLRAAGSAGVYNDRAALVAALRALP